MRGKTRQDREEKESNDSLHQGTQWAQEHQGAKETRNEDGVCGAVQGYPVKGWDCEKVLATQSLLQLECDFTLESPQEIQGI